MTWRPKRRQPRRGKSWKSRRTTPIANGTSGLPFVNGSLPVGALLGKRTNARRTLRLLLKDLNAKQLHKKG